VGVDEEGVAASLFRDGDLRLEAAEAHRTGDGAGDDPTEALAASIAAFEEEIDMIDAEAGLGALVHGDTLKDVVTWVDARTRNGVGQIETDGRAIVRRWGRLGQSRQRARGHSGRDGEGAHQRQVPESGSGHTRSAVLS